MKQFVSIMLVGLGCFSSIQAAPQLDYANYGQVTVPSNIDAVRFENFGTFDFTNSQINTNFGVGGGSVFDKVLIPFVTRDTLYFTNTGTIQITPGFRFDTGTATTRQSAASFDNTGTIIGEDTPADLFVTLASSSSSLPGPQPSSVLVFATNISNVGGSIAVGNDGLLQMTGSNINLSNGSLAAGTVSESDANDLTGRENSQNEFLFLGFPFVDPVGVYDLIWGTNTGLGVSITPDPGTGGTYTVQFVNDVFPFSPFSTRDGAGFFNLTQNAFESNSFPGQSVFANLSGIGTISNNNFFEVNIVFVNTNLPDTNITVNVGFNNVFSSNRFFFGLNTGTESIVQFSETVPDVVSGQTVTNSIYLLDSGSLFRGFLIQTNAAYLSGFGRPDCFEITTSLPVEWTTAQPANAVFNTNSINGFGFFNFLNDAFYRAQVGRNPEELDGSFTLLETNFAGVKLVDVPDPTNEPGRLEIYGDQLNLSGARLRGEGVASITATNLTGSMLAGDWGNINGDINVTNGMLTVSNIFPTTFKRLRGDITAWCNNEFVTNVTGGVTNIYYSHILWVGPSLKGTFRSSIRNLALRATNTTVVQDNLRVIGNSLILASNLTLDSEVDLTQNAGSLFPTNTPNLKHLIINTNGSLNADNIIDIGFNMSTGNSVPLKRKYTVPSIVNYGSMMATAPLLQSSNFECDGSIIASNGGSMIIEAASLGLGPALTNATNLLQADENITLSANVIGSVNSQIVAGGIAATGRGQLLLQTTANGEITDFASGAPSTNASLVNFWQVTDGFSLPVKPATGDLFGTKITTIAMGYTVALHTWAGVDLGPSATGFADNMVIGHLTLSRDTNAVLHFTGAGAKNAMYVDYLELDDTINPVTFNDYRHGLVIDSNLTIYFAACNADPIKLETVYSNRFVWVPSFAGPNSTVAVPYLGSTNVCLMNASLADSHEISFFGSVPNANNQPYVLNDPSNPTNIFPCPSDSTMFKDFVIGTSISNDVNVGISIMGEGRISPDIKRSQVAVGKKFALTATPAKGWAFAGWSVRGLPEGVNTTSRVLRFTIENNLMLTANFTPRPFTLVKGSYYGLFTNSSPAPDNSGWFTFTLGEDGALSGRLLIGPTNYTFSSTFPTNGLAQVIAKHDSQSLTVTLNLNLADPSGQVVGNVTDGAWSSPLLGYVGPTSWTMKEPSPFAGRYTMVFTNGGTNVATGDSYGSLIVSKPGVLSVGGRLADGEVFSQTVPISKDGFWPFYAYVARGGDFLFGWIAFQDNPIHGATMGETNLFWSKGPSSKDGYYPAGFTSTFNLTGSPYAFPGKNSSGLALTDPVVVLSGGGLGSALTNPVVYDGKLTYASSNLILSINPGLGIFTGRLQSSGDGPSIKLSGVVLQNQDGAFGFFPGTDNESGAVLLQGQ